MVCDLVCGVLCGEADPPSLDYLTRAGTSRRSGDHLLKIIILVVGRDERPAGGGKLLDDKPIVTVVAFMAGGFLFHPQ